ncbi:MAG: hypothetical protein GKR89_23270 [Candidatus Latescibacteria bacterium]|nr:hypothetical protein [Candidatus Latescibacterota bacterium]
MLSRENIIAVLSQSLADLPYIKAAWLTGSDAFERADEWSDIDLRAVPEVDAFDAVFTAVEEALKKVSEIELMYSKPADGSGHRQKFYRLKNASPHHFIDFVLFREEGLEPFLHPERNGRSLVLFDRAGIVATDPDNNQKLRPEFAARIKDIEFKFKMFGRVLVERSVARGHFTDAVFQYTHRILYPTIEVVRAVHSPLRQDLGPRYLVWDVPEDIRMEIENLHKIKDTDHILVLLEQAENLFARYIDIYKKKSSMPSLERGER